MERGTPLQTHNRPHDGSRRTTGCREQIAYFTPTIEHFHQLSFICSPFSNLFSLIASLYKHKHVTKARYNSYEHGQGRISFPWILCVFHKKIKIWLKLWNLGRNVIIHPFSSSSSSYVLFDFDVVLHE